MPKAACGWRSAMTAPASTPAWSAAATACAACGRGWPGTGQQRAGRWHLGAGGGARVSTGSEFPPAPVTVLLADDHPVVREGLRGMLAAEPGIRVIAEAASGG